MIPELAQPLPPPPPAPQQVEAPPGQWHAGPLLPSPHVTCWAPPPSSPPPPLPPLPWNGPDLQLCMTTMTGYTLIMHVKATDSISFVKHKIWDGFLHDLIFDGEVLANHLKLSEINIRNSVVLNFVVQRQMSHRIHVVLCRDMRVTRTLVFQITPGATIDCVKKLVQDKEPLDNSYRIFASSGDAQAIEGTIPATNFAAVYFKRAFA
jgi:hypothetical protein